MATLRKRGDYQWQAQVRKKNYPPQSRTFDFKVDAEKWAKDTEAAMARGVFQDRHEAEITTLSEALSRYAREATPRKKGAKREMSRIKVWQTHRIASLSLAALRGSDLAKYRDERRKTGIADATIRLELMLISAVYRKARTDWGISGLASPTHSMALPASSKARSRRLQPQEEHYLFAGIASLTTEDARVSQLVGLAIETGMRQGELLRLEWDDVDLQRAIAHLDDSKSGDPRDVPLSPAATAIFASLSRPSNGGRVFGIRQDRLIRLFAAACLRGRELRESENTNPPNSLGFLAGLKFHDLRHEAASRWAPHLNAQELCKMFGWRTMQIALRYYHPTGESLAAKLALVKRI